MSDKLNDVSIMPNPGIQDGDIEQLIDAFETSAQFDENDIEFWFARDLQVLLGYSKWENFESVLSRATESCVTAGQIEADHFQEVFPEVRKNPEGGRPSKDFRLSRYACYLITQNGDARKKPIAFGQTYFAIQTRRQELADQKQDAKAIPQSEDEKRILLRSQIKEHNRYLSSAAKNAGVTTPLEFAVFHSNGYQGMYQKTVPEIRKHRGLNQTADILDRMGSTELAANFFRVTQTEEKLRKDNIKTSKSANATHHAVGQQVRKAMLEISGIAPESLPVTDSIKHALKRVKLEQVQFPSKDIDNLLAQENQIEDISIDDRKPIDIQNDLWKFALLVMATRTNGEIKTSELIAELPNYIYVPDNSQEALSGRKDNKFSQLVRNLKSHKTAKTNFIYQGFAEDISDGFKITVKGLNYIKTYFKT